MAERCPLCQSPVRIKAERIPGYQVGLHFTIKECEGCGASFAEPLAVDDEIYAHIYEHSRYVPGYNRYFRYAMDVSRQRNPLEYLSRQEESYWAVERYLRSLDGAAAKVSVLEVGCGMGYFTHALSRAGYDVRGIDLSSKAIAWATEHFGPNFSTQTLQQLDAEGRRFDVVVMNQLIEHVPDVHGFLAEAVRVLADDGALLITTPNKTSYPGAVWATELPPVHLWWLGENAMRQVASRHGCTVSFVDFTEFYRVHLRRPDPSLREFDARQILDAHGKPLRPEEIPAPGPLRHRLERSGLLHAVRAARSLLVGGERRRGPVGEVMAAILRKGRAPQGPPR